MNATHRSPLKLVKQSVGWNNAKEQICNQCTSRLSRYLWFIHESGGIFPTSSAVARSRFSAGVAITNISMQLALLHSELDYLTYNWTSRHGTGYTFTWPRPTVEPLWWLWSSLSGYQLYVYSGGYVFTLVNKAGIIKFWFLNQIHLKGQGQSLPKTIGILTKMFCIFCLNLVVLTCTGDEFSRRQAQGWHTDKQTQATTIL